jgi:hypothetical protein
MKFFEALLGTSKLANKDNWTCPVHGNQFSCISIFGSKRICTDCIKEFIDKTFPEVKPIEEETK